MLPQTLEELNAIRDECKAMVTRRAGLSAGAVVIPIPGIDIGADVSLLMEMIPAINEKFGLSPQQIEQLPLQLKKITVVAITSVGSEMVGKMVTKHVLLQILKKVGVRVTSKAFVRFIPILGQTVAATVSFGAMKMVGNAHVEDCYKVVKDTLLAVQQLPDGLTDA
ncbi:protein of unknown function [Pseudomonas pohangensis]|jgi:uncharacterized protein (DUF697 family)|uniref:DUF697 domain-containing protein n=1 Tax=Pseudomonas pohangensis TaxID=364197 RepID=A0A1H2GQS5_9PSED|nr:hypothetical protein [Pseudomonas pohangensis]SDU21819.1 protein of unknown function [Pseudomonas pohangensis]